MKVVFFSDFLNHHQVTVADELYEMTGGAFRFVELFPMPDHFKKIGYPNYSDKCYLIKWWEGKEARKCAYRWAIEADVARFGTNAPFDCLKDRLNNDSLTFEVSERWLKKGWINLFSPLLIKNQLLYHFILKTNGFYKLCSSAYCSGDQHLLRSFKNKCYKWGYFTKVDDIDINALNRSKVNKKTTIMWCSRFIDWKHPEIVVSLARRLSDNNYDVSLDMYGTGPELERVKKMAQENNVQNIISFRGNMPNEKIISAMHQHDIFLFTSDRNEGWGAVLNEAMSNGCVIVASNAIGSVPFIVNDGKNGMVFRSERLESLYEKVVYLIEHPFERQEMALNAYYTMRDIWSPKKAAMNFLQLSDDLLHARESSIIEGPCSIAKPIRIK